MFPVLTITTTDDTTTAECTSLDLWIAETLQESTGKGGTSEHGTRLIVAYMHCTGKEPKTLGEVKTWARENAVRVEMGRPVDPTLTDPGEGSSSE